MKKLSVLLAIVAMFGLGMAACGDDGGPHCVDAWTLIPCATEASPTGCDVTGTTPLCCNDTCVAMPTDGCMTTPCDAGQLCDVCASPPACEATCAEACPTGQYCSGTTCVDIPVAPVCSPVCAAGEVCVN